MGSGKSEAAKIFAELGAFVIDTDALAREAVAPHSDGLLEIARVWPAVVRGGMLDRSALAEIVFRDPNARTQLERILHPHIRRLALQHEAHAARDQLRVHVVPLLFETGYGNLVDKSVLVVAPDAQRIARIAARDRIDEAHIRDRMAAQISPDEARRRADYVIENDGDLVHLRTRVNEVYHALVQAG